MSVQTRLIGITGVGQSDTQRGPIFRINTTDGVEYSTFNGQMANQARQLVGQQVILSYVEKPVTKNGQVYLNRYYEGAEPTGQQSTTGDAPMSQLTFGTPANQPPATAYAAPAGPSRDTQIHRQTASKVAAIMLGYLPEVERTPDGLVAIAEYLVAYYESGPRKAAPSAPADPGPQSFFADTPPSDDDIPF